MLLNVCNMFIAFLMTYFIYLMCKVKTQLEAPSVDYYNREMKKQMIEKIMVLLLLSLYPLARIAIVLIVYL